MKRTSCLCPITKEVTHKLEQYWINGSCNVSETSDLTFHPDQVLLQTELAFRGGLVTSEAYKRHKILQFRSCPLENFKSFYRQNKVLYVSEKV